MQKIQQIVPVTDLRLRHVEVFDMLDRGPVVLAQRSRPAAVLVSIEQWDSMVEEVEELQARRRDEAAIGRTLTDHEWATIKQARATIARGGPTISHEELKAQMQARYGHVTNQV